MRRFELPAPASRRQCSTRLSYTPKSSPAGPCGSASIATDFKACNRDFGRCSGANAKLRAAICGGVNSRGIFKAFSPVAPLQADGESAISPLPYVGPASNQPGGMGRRQVVRHRFLVSTFPGSNPGAPAISSLFTTIFCEQLTFAGPRKFILTGLAGQHP